MFFVIFHVSVKPGSSKPAKACYGIFFFHWSISLNLLLTNRQTDIEYAGYFKVIKFQKKPSMKNGSFRFVGLRNWFVIHESRTLNSYSVKCCAISGKSKFLGGLHTLVIRERVQNQLCLTCLYIMHNTNAQHLNKVLLGNKLNDSYLDNPYFLVFRYFLFRVLFQF